MRAKSPPLPETLPMQQCPLCGLRFREFSWGECAACSALHKGCSEEPRCPDCGYRFPRESSLLNLAKRLFRGR